MGETFPLTGMVNTGDEMNITKMEFEPLKGVEYNNKSQQCPAMYTKSQKKLTQNKQKESRPLPFWLTAKVKENYLFVTNKGNAGRLGNKLFELAGVFGVSKLNNRTPILKLNTWKMINKYFDIRIIFSDNFIQNTSNMLTFIEKICHTRMNETQKLLPKNVTIGLYLISRLYFEHAEEELRKELMFKNSVIQTASKFLNQSFPAAFNGTTFARVVIHVRRTDLLLGLNRASGFIDLTPDYFLQSMNYFRQCYEQVQFIVISDDISWCKKNVVGPDVIYSEGHSPGEDLAVSSLCDHAITTFGTFSMWVAWFANGITIRPLKAATPNSTAFQNFKLQDEGYPLDTVKL